MAQKAADQVTIIDITDAYSVILTSEAYTFPGTTTTAKAGSTTTQVVAMLGADQVPASVTLSEITPPTGVTVTKDTDTTAPTLTISVTTAVTAPGNITIPVHIGDVTINKVFSYGIALTGQGGAAGKGISSTKVEYQVGTSGTDAPTGAWTTTIPAVPAAKYLWTRTTYTYTDSSTVVSYSVGMMGQTGNTGVGVQGAVVTYVASTSGTATPSTGWASTIPTVPQGQYLWTRTVTTYTDSTTSTSYSVALAGKDGANGADALTLSVTSSNGLIFKNSAIATVLTAHVYKAGVELTGTSLTAQGTIKWYKDGGSTAVATGATLTIDAGQVSNKATYTATLED